MKFINFVCYQENNRLSAKLGAHESVITGLREERKLWGHELALQGASLAQDRGKMEGQIESLNRELKELKDKLEVTHSTINMFSIDVFTHMKYNF